MPYYPKSRIVENKNSDFDEFVKINGEEYIGPYYTTFNGKSFTGPNPNTPNSQLLISTQPPKDPNANPDLKTPAVFEYSSIKPPNPDLVDPTAALVDPPPFTPRPTEEDYKTGRITRYIARQNTLENASFPPDDFGEILKYTTIEKITKKQKSAPSFLRWE
jgi:hypothetical protein